MLNYLRTLGQQAHDVGSLFFDQPSFFNAGETRLHAWADLVGDAVAAMRELWGPSPGVNPGAADELAEAEAEQEVTEPAAESTVSDGILNIASKIGHTAHDLADAMYTLERRDAQDEVLEELRYNEEQIQAAMNAHPSGGQVKQFGPRPRLATAGPPAGGLTVLPKLVDNSDRFDRTNALLEEIRDTLTSFASSTVCERPAQSAAAVVEEGPAAAPGAAAGHLNFTCNDYMDSARAARDFGTRIFAHAPRQHWFDLADRLEEAAVNANTTQPNVVSRPNIGESHA